MTSKPNVGTTMWIHVPSGSVGPEKEPRDIHLGQVVKIRGPAKLGGA